MKNTLCALIALGSLLFVNKATAQDSTRDTTTRKKHHYVSLNTAGLKVYSADSAQSAAVGRKDKKRFNTSVGPVDLGINIFADNTNYNDPSLRSFLRVPANEANKSLFDLRQGKSINVNIYPLSVSFRALKTRNQKIYFASGLGLQLYNFRFEEPITFVKNPTGVIMDSITFHKNKLALDYLNIPLMITFKTRIDKSDWLVYGVGLTEGYLIASWTKQESGPRGKVRIHDAFGLSSFNTCITAEIGLDDSFRFFASYQLTSMFSNALDLHPFSFGIRFSGI